MDYYKLLRDAGLCTSRTEFCREWLGRSFNYLTKMENKPAIAAVLTLYMRLQDAGHARLAAQVYKELEKMVDAPKPKRAKKLSFDLGEPFSVSDWVRRHFPVDLEEVRIVFCGCDGDTAMSYFVSAIHDAGPESDAEARVAVKDMIAELHQKAEREATWEEEAEEMARGNLGEEVDDFDDQEPPDVSYDPRVHGVAA